ncbi:MAG: hypothetical protein ACM37W_26465 [Actinomycetota bacterium]
MQQTQTESLFTNIAPDESAQINGGYSRYCNSTFRYRSPQEHYDRVQRLLYPDVVVVRYTDRGTRVRSYYYD